MRKFLKVPAYAISLQNLLEVIWCIRTIFTRGGKGSGFARWACGRQALLVFINQNRVDMIVDRYLKRIDIYSSPLRPEIINEAIHV